MAAVSHGTTHVTKQPWPCKYITSVDIPSILCMRCYIAYNQSFRVTCNQSTVRLLGISELSVSAIQKWSNNQCETAWNYRTVCQCYTKSDQSINQSINTQRKETSNQQLINQSVNTQRKETPYWPSHQDAGQLALLEGQGLAVDGTLTLDAKVVAEASAQNVWPQRVSSGLTKGCRQIWHMRSSSTAW